MIQTFRLMGQYQCLTSTEQSVGSRAILNERVRLCDTDPGWSMPAGVRPARARRDFRHGHSAWCGECLYAESVLQRSPGLHDRVVQPWARESIAQRQL